MLHWVWIFIFHSLIYECRADIKFDFDSKRVVDCGVAILGSGFAGSFAAYQLSSTYKDTMCIIEKSDRDGGRVWDVSEYSGGPVYGMGALRISGNHKTMMALANELKIEMQKVDGENELFKVRGQYFYQAPSLNVSETRLMCEKVFSNLTCNYGNKSPDEAMIELLIKLYLSSSDLLKRHPDIVTFILAIFGDEGLAFLRESIAYKSFFASVSASATLEFLIKGLKNSMIRYHPVGGMSEYIKRMLATASGNGVKIYRNEPVLRINSDPFDSDSIFYIETPTYLFKTKRVLCSIDPYNFRNVGGNFADFIMSSNLFQVLKPVHVAVASVWWNSRWWEESKFYKNVPFSRVTSSQNCFNSMLIPAYPYGRNQNVTRAVYDDGTCVDTWKTLINLNNTNMLADEVVSSLQNFFHDVKVPKPRHLIGHVHPNAWYLQYPDSRYTNDQIFDWSQRPIANKSFAFIGEPYNRNFAGWCDGALKSAMTVLSKFYGVTFPCFNDVGSPANCPKLLKDDIGEVKRLQLNSLLP